MAATRHRPSVLRSPAAAGGRHSHGRLGTNLKHLNHELRVPLVQLIGGSGAPYDLVASGDPRTYDDLATSQGLAEIARCADGIGPSKSRIIPRDENGSLTEPTSLVDDAHSAGLTVHPWTFRPAEYGDIFAECRAFLATGIDGLFADQPDIAIEAAESARG
jgi:glycerophosphoryl diester phosphodiesterase